jgi:glycosyltransferase involved in cell wall biosynthesis
LEAFALLRREWGVELPLLLVGRRGWLYEEIFATIDRLALGRAVVHLERVDNALLASLYRRAVLLALPSHYEGFGLPPLEAMHCGCPVVVSDRASLPEVVGEAGIQLAPEDARTWASAMARLLADGALREEMIQRGYVQAARFTWEATARATLRLYTGVEETSIAEGERAS